MNRTALCFLLAAPVWPLLAQPAPAPAAASAEAEAEAVLSAARSQGEALVKARAAFIEAGGAGKDFRADLGKQLPVMAARLRTETRPPVRWALIVSQLYLHRLVRATPVEALLTLTFQEVPATYPGWALDKGLLLALGGWSPAAAEPYLAKARAEFPLGPVRSYLLFEYFTEMIDTGTENQWRPPFEALRKDFPGSPEAAKAAERLASEAKTAVGALAPAFSVPALGDPATVYTLASFKGHYLLLDFWASWCPDCVAEMATLHKAFARFQGRGLELLSLSFDRKVEHIAAYRQHPASPMPWKHTFLDGAFKNPLSEAYGVKSIPKPVLIGPDGRIVANGGDLHGAKLEATLERFLGR